MPIARSREAPSPGQTVKLRGRQPFGTLIGVDDRGWAQVAWSDTTAKGPQIVHIDELERVLN